jgi:hydroxymethylglutaryl-CoA synthase
MPEDFCAAVFHQPNLRFPVRLARELGFSRKQIEDGLLVESIGNTYAGSSMIGLSAVLDVASPGQRVLQVSFGSGAGSDAFCWTVTDKIEASRDLAPTTRDYMSRRREIDYATYVRYRSGLRMH